MSARTRAELIGDLLDLAAMLAADEAIPFDRQTPAFSHHVYADTDEAGIHRLGEIAAILGVEPTRSAGGRHHEAIKMVGGIEYKAVYVERQDMADYSAFMATRPAWRAAREIAGAVSE